ncbi:tetratricopeptide repeat protein [Occallatibacter riparius]|uniref:Tetratricopeptide repeat protein n=1 Tax=Occallatibacter riparius TaxID=1002689 RepID=A0A9J7BUG3_9BACT|nr:tetratricopeptide repeat protein [Occallatibacter riparius]UWZ84566.1 tetratricopeptide repeat protein [Occallatibacter riparius]
MPLPFFLSFPQGICCSLILLLISLAPLRAQTTSHSSLDQKFQTAMAAEDAGDFDKARTLLLELRQQRPHSFPIEESLGLIYVAQQKYAEALPFLQEAARLQPGSDIAHANLGAALYNLQRNNEAIKEFELAARLNPKSAVAQQSLGQLYLDKGDAAKACTAFAAALRLKPGDEDLMFSYAATLVAANRYSDAAQALASASTASQSPLAQSLLGEIDEHNGNYESAVHHFTSAAELQPSEDNIWQLGMEFLRHWTFEAAVKEFEAGAERFPSSTRMKVALGAAYFGNGAYAKAIPQFAGLLSSDPNNAGYAQMLGLSCTAVMQETDSRCALLVTYADAHSQDAAAATHAATFLLTNPDAGSSTDHAGRLLESAVKARPDLSEAQYQLGVLKQNQSDWPGSVPYLERAVALKPNHAQAHYHLALAYWRTGRKADGQTQMELQKKYASAEKEDLDRRLKQITTFVVNLPPSR